MAIRSKAEIIAEAKEIAKKFSIVVSSDADQIIVGSADASLTYEQAVLRLMCIQVELLTNIRQADKNP